MDLVSGYKGVVGLVFGNENSASNEDSYVERLLDRISNGSLVEDRRMAITELLSVVSESSSAQLAFGAIGFPVLMSVLKEERDDVEMVRNSLETLVSAITPIGQGKAQKNQVQPALMNADLLSREAESISTLLSLLPEEDFYIRYYTLQLLTALLTNSPNRLQEAILTVPRGITQLMDMLLDREVIRNEALLLLTYLTRGAEEIQKIVVFEGVFERIFSIIREEGGSDGGVVVQDCLELLKNLLRKNSSNQVLLRETVGFDQLISILKVRGSSFSFTQQKAINLLSVLETINLLIVEDAGGVNCFTNRTILVQKTTMDHLLVLGVESRWAPVSVRCMVLRCIGNLIVGHRENLDALSSKVLGGEPQVETALNSLLRIALRTSSMQEFMAADYVFNKFCENNPDGQIMLASTMIPELHSTRGSGGEDVNMPFGSILLHGLSPSENDTDLQTCARAASVLSHLLLGNIHCKEKVLQIRLEAPIQELRPPEPLMCHMVKYLALASNVSTIAGIPSNSLSTSFQQPIILKLLVIWLAECPSAVHCFLDSRPHLTYLLDLVATPSANACIKGLAAVLLGECIVYNRSSDSSKDAFTIIDTIAKTIGLTAYFLKFEEMRKDVTLLSQTSDLQKPTSRSNAASVTDVEDADGSDGNDQNNEYNVLIASIFNSGFCGLLDYLEGKVRESTVVVYSHTKNKMALVPVELAMTDGESNENYIRRLKTFMEEQCAEIQDLLDRNAILAENLAKTTGIYPHLENETGGGSGRRSENLRRDLREATKRIEVLSGEKAKLENEAGVYKNLAEKAESDLKSLSDAYNSLEQAHFCLEREAESLKNGDVGPVVDIEAIKEEALKESESELNDLLVCLGQEQSKVDRLTTRLTELGEDVDKLLQGIMDDVVLPDNDSEAES